MSDVSEHLLRNDDRYSRLSEYLVSLPLEQPTIISIHDHQGEIHSRIVVTLLTAGHCPGSVMFLIEGDNGRVLYTGDFRLPVGGSSRLLHLHDEGRLKPVDALYVDTTFCNERSLYIPSREQCMSEILALIKPWLAKGPDHIVHFICPAQYNYEYVFVEIFKEFGEKTHVTKERLKKYRGIKNIEDAVTSVTTDARIHACFGNNDGRYKEIFYNPYTPCNYHVPDFKPIKVRLIKPSAMFFQNNIFNKVSSLDGSLHRVCFSTHSSLSEIRDVVDYLKPKRVYPNVVQKQTVDEILHLLNVVGTQESIEHLKDFVSPLGSLEENEMSGSPNVSNSFPFYDSCYEISRKHLPMFPPVEAEEGAATLQDIQDKLDSTGRRNDQSTGMNTTSSEITNKDNLISPLTWECPQFLSDEDSVSSQKCGNSSDSDTYGSSEEQDLKIMNVECESNVHLKPDNAETVSYPSTSKVITDGTEMTAPRNSEIQSGEGLKSCNLNNVIDITRCEIDNYDMDDLKRRNESLDVNIANSGKNYIDRTDAQSSAGNAHERKRVESTERVISSSSANLVVIESGNDHVSSVSTSNLEMAQPAAVENCCMENNNKSSESDNYLFIRKLNIPTSDDSSIDSPLTQVNWRDDPSPSVHAKPELMPEPDNYIFIRKISLKDSGPELLSKAKMQNSPSSVAKSTYPDHFKLNPGASLEGKQKLIVATNSNILTNNGKDNDLANNVKDNDLTNNVKDNDLTNNGKNNDLTNDNVLTNAKDNDITTDNDNNLTNKAKNRDLNDSSQCKQKDLCVRSVKDKLIKDIVSQFSQTSNPLSSFFDDAPDSEYLKCSPLKAYDSSMSRSKKANSKDFYNYRNEQERTSRQCIENDDKNIEIIDLTVEDHGGPNFPINNNENCSSFVSDFKKQTNTKNLLNSLSTKEKNDNSIMNLSHSEIVHKNSKYNSQHSSFTASSVPNVSKVGEFRSTKSFSNVSNEAEIVELRNSEIVVSNVRSKSEGNFYTDSSKDDLLNSVFDHFSHSNNPLSPFFMENPLVSSQFSASSKKSDVSMSRYDRDLVSKHTTHMRNDLRNSLRCDSNRTPGEIQVIDVAEELPSDFSLKPNTIDGAAIPNTTVTTLESYSSDIEILDDSPSLLHPVKIEKTNLKRLSSEKCETTAKRKIEERFGSCAPSKSPKSGEAIPISSHMLDRNNDLNTTPDDLIMWDVL